ncbi:uncharacterized protein [Antedon mediterranea]|uniref:uncharacterized protein n=1 Tax=Antedon mediterranea TaxID=105859 RepID=UPI003AF51F5B
MPTTTITTTGVDTTTGGSTTSALPESVTSSMPTTTIKTTGVDTTTGGSTTSALSESVTSSMPTTTITTTGVDTTGGSTTSALPERVTSSMPTTTITTTGVDTTTGGSTTSALSESVTSSMPTTKITTTGVDTTTDGSTTSALPERVTSSMPTTTITTTTGVDTTTGGSTTSALPESVTSSMPTTKITTTGVDTTTGGSTTSALSESVTSSMPTTTITTTGVDTTTDGSTTSALPERVTSSMPTTTITTTTGVDTTTGGSTTSALPERVTSSVPTTTITTTTGVDTTTGGSTASALSESVTSSMPTTTITTTGVDTTTGRSTTSALPERVTSSIPTTTTVESNSGGGLVASVPPLNLSNTNAGEGGDLVSTTIPLYDPTDADVQKIIDRSNQRNNDSGEDSMEEEDNSGEDSMEEEDNSGEDSMEEEDNSGEDSMEEEEEGQKAKAAPTIPPPRPSIQSLISSKTEDLSSCATALCVNQSVSSVHWAIEQSSGDIDTEILLTYFKFIDTLLNSSLPTTNTLFQVLKKIDSLLNVSNLPVKHSIQEDTNVTSSLLSAVENVAIKYFLLKPNESRINGINEFNVRWVNFASKRGDTKMNFTNKEEIVAELSTTSVLDAYDYMVSIVYEGLHLNQPNKETIGSHIMSVAFANQNGNKLNGGIHLQLKLNLVEDVYTIPTCNFWDVHQSDWSDYGCQVMSFNDSWVNCLCNHTTSFAVLMQVSEVSISETNEKVLSMITLIGVSISIICLVLTLLSYIVLKLLHQKNIAIHANLALSLLFAHLIYITGIDATGNKTVCKIIAILLHYFFLASFAWMMIEGAYLYVKSSHAHRKPLTLLHYALIGWVSPLFIVGITAAARYNGYGTPEACWLGLEDGVTWAFVAPVLVVGIINTLIMVRVIKTFNSLKTNADKARTQRMRANLRAILVLQPLLGVTWLFGVLSFNFVWALSFVYLFVICNSLQGAFIFLLHCVMNDEVRKAAFNRLNRFIAIRRGHHGVHPTTNSSSTGTTGLKRTTTSW